MDPNILDRSPFFNFKSNSIGLFEAIKTYYRNLTSDLKEIQDKKKQHM
jgi:hypothetical protein